MLYADSRSAIVQFGERQATTSKRQARDRSSSASHARPASFFFASAPDIMAELDLRNPALALSYLPTPLTVFQLRPDQPVPPALLDVLIDARGEQSFVSATRCKDELSVILPTALFEELYPSSVRPHLLTDIPPSFSADKSTRAGRRAATRVGRPLGRAHHRGPARPLPDGDPARPLWRAQGRRRAHLCVVDVEHRLCPH